MQSQADGQPVGWTTYLGNFWVPVKIYIGFTILFIGIIGG